MKKFLILMLVLSLLVVGVALANNLVEVTRWVFGSGATDATAGEVSLRAALGQPVIGNVSGGEVTVRQGFSGGGIPPDDRYFVYLPLTQR